MATVRKSVTSMKDAADALEKSMTSLIPVFRKVAEEAEKFDVAFRAEQERIRRKIHDGTRRTKTDPV